MKKVILIIMLILMIPVVKAKDLLEYDLDWESKIYDSPVANTYEYKDGYLFGDYGHDLSFNLSYYDKQGNFKKEIKIDDLVMLVYPEEYIYVLSGRYTNTTISFVLQAYNENLELVKEVVVFTEDNDGVSIYDHPDSSRPDRASFDERPGTVLFLNFNTLENAFSVWDGRK